MRGKKHIILAWILLIIIVVSGCNQDIETGSIPDNNDKEDKEIDSNDRPVDGGRIYIPLTNFNTLNPLLTDNSSYYYFSKLIFEGLFEFDDNLDPAPKLADSYSIRDGGKTVSIKLKNNVLWHDGESLTSSDVEFTIEAIKYAYKNGTYGKIFDTALGYFDSYKISNLINVNIIDDLNLEITFNKVYSNNLETLTFPIIAKHAYYKGNRKIDYSEALKLDKYKPLGTGPYKFESYEKFKNIHLKKNENYWDGSPYIDEVVGRVLGDEKLILNAFETGQVNFASSLDVDWDKYKQNKRIKVLEYIGADYEFLGFNFKNELLASQKGLAIRKAINYGIDRQNIIERVYLNHASQIDVPIHPDSYLVSSDAYNYGYNIERARKILTEAGFIQWDGDQVLMDEDGNKLSFKLITNSYNPLRMKTMEIIADQLKEIGINIIIDSPRYYREDEISKKAMENQWRSMEEKVRKGDFDIVLLGWTTSVITDLLPMFHSSSIKEGSNFINYSSESIDKLIEEAYKSSSREGKIRNFAKIQKQIVDELPYISLVFRNRGLLMDTKIKGDLSPSFYNLYKGLEKCYIPEALQ